MIPRLSFAFLICLCVPAPPAQAAKSYDNCTGFVDAVPAVITTQGTWCLRADLSSALTSGSLIQIAVNNVTLDCNDFKLGGLAAGIGTLTEGVLVNGRSNAVIRNCNIRGFKFGIRSLSGSGQLIENNRFDGNTVAAILQSGMDGTIRGNVIFDTGGAPSENGAYGIIALNAAVDIIDNTITRVFRDSGDAIGILASGLDESVIERNRIRGISGPVNAGMNISSAAVDERNIMVKDNVLMGSRQPGALGILCAENSVTASRNLLGGFSDAVLGCFSDGNVVNPN